MQNDLWPDQDMPGVNGKARPSHEDVARVAYFLWMKRGCPDGSPEEDWHEAENRLTALPEIEDDIPEKTSDVIV